MSPIDSLPKLYIGCAVWSYKGWVGDFYPARTQPKDFLTVYSQQFNTVEGNTTFYAVPSAKTIKDWQGKVGANFRFCPKLPKDITHKGLLYPKIESAKSFLKTVSGLESNLGFTFAQLPPSYSPNHLEDLSAFLTELKEYSLALEVRHLDWFVNPAKEQLNQLLTSLKITKVLLDTRPIYECSDDPQATSKRRKPKLPLQPIATRDRVMVRFISHPQFHRNQRYLEKWATQVKNWLDRDIAVYFFVHCPIEDYSPATAQYLMTLLEGMGVSVDSIALKRTISEDSPPTQLKLF